MSHAQFSARVLPLALILLCGVCPNCHSEDDFLKSLGEKAQSLVSPTPKPIPTLQPAMALPGNLDSAGADAQQLSGAHAQKQAPALQPAMPLPGNLGTSDEAETRPPAGDTPDKRRFFNFLVGFFNSMIAKNIGPRNSFYAPEVNYYGNLRTPAQILQEDLDYNVKWPIKDYAIKEKKIGIEATAQGRFRALYTILYKVSNGTKSKAGELKMEILARPAGNSFLIDSENILH